MILVALVRVTFLSLRPQQSSLARIHGGAGWKIHYFGELWNPDRLGVGGAEPLFQLSR